MNANLYFFTWIFISYIFIGVTSGLDLVCSILDVINFTGDSPACAVGLTKQCCRWNSDTQDMDIMCCPTGGQCKNEYDPQTCGISRCYQMQGAEVCNQELFMELAKVSGDLPAGASGVAECCRRDDQDRKTHAYCCLAVGGKTECYEGLTTVGCVNENTGNKRFNIMANTESRTFNVST